VGAGHTEQEFAAMGVPFAERGAITDEVLDTLVTIWTEPDPVFEGEYFRISGLAVDPRPVQQPRPPIHVGGNSKPALRRAARFDGWQPNPTNWDISGIPASMDYIRAQDSFRGKEDSFDVNWLSGPDGVDLPDGFAAASPTQLRGYRDRLTEAYCGTYREYGITRTAARAPLAIASVAEFLDWLGWFAAEVIPAVNPSDPS
ncbi:MAG: LLM class flavin-dependent oxidoreductase, partial [Propionibacterium sp.]|nr:LLM class flavin-dependent oxidoreductase [Propionibacterium sp.]